MWGLQGILWLLGGANAHTPPEETEKNIDDVVEELEQVTEQNTLLQEELDKLSKELKTVGNSDTLKQAVIENLSILIDTRQEEQARIQAIRALNDIKENKTLPFYWSVLGETPSISLEILDGLGEFTDVAEVRNIVQKGLYIQSSASLSRATIKVGKNTDFGFYTEKPPELDSDLVLKTISIAGQLQKEEIASLLMDFTKDMSVPYSLRLAAFTTLETSYADFLDKNGRYSLERESNMIANQLYALSVGTTTSVLLGSVGVWGQSDVSEGISSRFLISKFPPN